MYAVRVNQLTYPVRQVNGQRISGPPLEFGFCYEPRPDTNEIYVTNIPRQLYETELLPIFARCGPIYKFRLMMCFSGMNRGFAYVLYYHTESAKRCLAMLHSIHMMDKIVYTHPSSNKRVLIMGNVDPATENVEKRCFELTRCIKVFKMPNHAYQTYILYYQTHHLAALARRNFMPHINEFGSKCFVRWFRQN